MSAPNHLLAWPQPNDVLSHQVCCALDSLACLLSSPATETALAPSLDLLWAPHGLLAHISRRLSSPKRKRGEEQLVLAYVACAGARLSTLGPSELSGRTCTAWQWAVQAGRALATMPPEAQAELLQLMNDLTLRCAPSGAGDSEEAPGEAPGEAPVETPTKADLMPPSLAVETLSAPLEWIRLVHPSSLPAAVGLAGQALALFWGLRETSPSAPVDRDSTTTQSHPATEAALALEGELCHMVESIGSPPLARMEAAAALAEAGRMSERVRRALPALREALEQVEGDEEREGARELLEATAGQLSDHAHGP